MKTLLALSLITFASVAMADLSLPGNGKTLKCTDGDMIKLEINANRTAIKVSFGGRNLGTDKVLKTHTGADYVIYETKAGELQFDDYVIFYKFKEGVSANFLDCE